jgi:serine phosphatase RsbU (regulator of sigma subunit)
MLSFHTYSQEEITEQMLQKIETEKEDSTKLKLYDKYFRTLSSNNENLILKYKNTALQHKPTDKRSEKQYAAILCVVGIAYKNVKEYDSCEKYQFAGLALYKKIKDKKGISMAYNGLGVLEKNRNNFIKSLEYYYKAIEPLDKEKDRKQFATTYMNIGIVYRNLRNQKRAIDYYNSCDSIYAILKDTAAIIKNNSNKCTALNEIGRTEEVKKLALYTEKLVDLIKLKNASAYNLYDLIGGIYVREKKYAEAEKYYLKRLDDNDELSNTVAMATTYQNLALLYQKWGKEVLANKYFNLAVESFSKKDIKSQKELLKLRISFLKAGGNYKDALELSERKYNLNDSIFSADLSEKVSKMENDISNQKRKKDLELLQKNQAIKDLEIKRQRFFNYGLVVIVLLIAVFAFFILRSLRVNKLINSELNIKNKKVEEQNSIIEEKNKDIIDSINYAQRLQQILLPAEEEFKQALPESFLFFEPKDIVSGDFYFIERTEEFAFVSVVDCTGHGVPGAIMSMVANNLLNKVVREKKLSKPAEILQELNKELYFSLKQNVSQKTASDGMDMAICVFYPAKRELHFGGANTSIYIVRNKELIELKPDKMGLGKMAFESKFKYTQQILKLEKNDMIYMGTDGYADQFGGERGKKMMKKNMQKLFIDIAEMPTDKQFNVVKDNFTGWKGKLGQVDDVTVLGFRV